MTNSKTSSKSSDTPSPDNPSQNSSTLFEPPERRQEIASSVGKTKAATGRSEKDLALKLGTAQTLASVGYFVRLNVSLSEPPLLSRWSGKLVDVTDVDVLALKHTIDFDTDIICVTAKAGATKGLSPIRESLTLAGVMQYFGADRGYAIFSERKIDPHMASLAQQLNIALYDDAEWRQWRNRSTGTHSIPVQFQESVDAKVFKSLNAWSDMRPLLAYIRNEFWYYRDFRNIQNLIGITRKLAAKFSSNALGRFVFCDVLSLFVISVLQLCQFVSTTGVTRLAESVPPYLFGGPSNYRSRRDLLKRVEDLLRSRALVGVEQTMPSLDPPYLPELMELVFRFCQKPAAAIRVPQYLSNEAGRAGAELDGNHSIERNPDDATVEKFALDSATFFVRATGLPAGLVSSSDSQNLPQSSLGR